MAKNIHVTPNAGRWNVKQEGRKTPVTTTATQKAASEIGRKLAQANKSELIIHRPNGRIREKNSYGNDPCPPRG